MLSPYLDADPASRLSSPATWGQMRGVAWPSHIDSREQGTGQAHGVMGGASRRDTVPYPDSSTPGGLEWPAYKVRPRHGLLGGHFSLGQLDLSGPVVHLVSTLPAHPPTNKTLSAAGVVRYDKALSSILCTIMYFDSMSLNTTSCRIW